MNRKNCKNDESWCIEAKYVVVRNWQGFGPKGFASFRFV